jgi:formate dehydrogenase accessory protein FdhD
MATGKMATETLNPPDIFARGSREMTVDQHKFADGWFLQTSDSIAEEVPVALVFNGISHAVMMATPLDLEDFAIGFSLAERIVDQASQIYDIVVVSNTAILGIELQIQIASECFVRLKNKRRSLSGKTGCGLCGLESLQSLDLATPRLNADHRVSKAALAKAFGQLSSKQVLNAATGSMHAAAWVNLEGNILCVREDVGRHNALDKLIGGLRCERREVTDIRDSVAGNAWAAGFAIMSSRASYELLQKSARAGISILATISVPTSLAISMAESAGICLIGFVREHGFVVYTHAQRLQAGSA